MHQIATDVPHASLHNMRLQSPPNKGKSVRITKVWQSCARCILQVRSLRMLHKFIYEGSYSCDVAEPSRLCRRSTLLDMAVIPKRPSHDNRLKCLVIFCSHVCFYKAVLNLWLVFTSILRESSKIILETMVAFLSNIS